MTTPSPEATEPLVDQAFLLGWDAALRRDKSFYEARDTARAALSSSISNAPLSSSHLDHNASVEVSSALADRVETSATTPTDSGEVVEADRDLLIRLLSPDADTIDAIYAGRAFTAEVEMLRDHRLAFSRPEPVGDQAEVLPGQVPPFLNAPTFDDRTEERVCINGCLFLRADYWLRRGLTPQPEPVGNEALVERRVIMRASKCGHHFDKECQSCQDALDCTNREMDRLRAAIQAIPAPATDAGQSADSLVEALTPSGATKAAYIGEFSFDIEEHLEGAVCPIIRKIDVPWTTIKEIMAAIRAYAASLPKSPSAGEEA